MKNQWYRRYGYISFDIFDTLIKRNVAKPTDIFYLLEEKTGIIGFADQRMKAQIQADKKFNGYATIDDIYEILNLPSVKCLEIQMEIDSCCANEKIKKIFAKYVQEEKYIVLISDMYLTSDVVEKMLQKCGYKGYKKIYISCEEKACKRNGSLFKKVLNDLQIRPGKLMHIGDNERSDWVIPGILGIKGLLVPRKRYKSDLNLKERTLLAISDNSSQEKGGFYSLGGEILGPLLWGFSVWLQEELNRSNIENVYFMSRDGWILKKAFDLLNNNHHVKTHYLYCSRRSYSVPLLWKHSSFDEIVKCINAPEKISLHHFLLYVGLDPAKYQERAKEHSLSLTYTYEKNSFYQDMEVKRFFYSIQEDIVKNSKKEFYALSSYVEQTGLYGKIAVVDIGYHGTMQNALVQLLKENRKDVDVKGFYVGVSPSARLINENLIDAKGYLYEANKNEDMEKQIKAFLPIFETLFLGQHGSVQKFTDNNGILEPCFISYEYDNPKGKLIEEKQVVNAIQQGALGFVDYMSSLPLYRNINFREKDVVASLLKKGLTPTLKDASFWGDFRFLDGTVRYIARPQHLNRNDFLNCMWKIGYLKRILKMPLPYQHIYYFLLKKYNK